MGEFALWGLFWIMIAIAFTGCFISKFPGPIVAFAAVLMMKLFTVVGGLINWWNIVVIGLLVAASYYITKMLPTWVKGLGTYSKNAKWGSIIGSIAGLIIAPAVVVGCEVENNVVALTVIIVTLILLTFIFATGMEFLHMKDIKAATKSGGVAAFEYTCATVVKLITVIYAVYLMLVNN